MIKVLKYKNNVYKNLCLLLLFVINIIIIYYKCTVVTVFTRLYFSIYLLILDTFILTTTWPI